MCVHVCVCVCANFWKWSVRVPWKGGGGMSHVTYRTHILYARRRSINLCRRARRCPPLKTKPPNWMRNGLCHRDHLFYMLERVLFDRRMQANMVLLKSRVTKPSNWKRNSNTFSVYKRTHSILSTYAGEYGTAHLWKQSFSIEWDIHYITYRRHFLRVTEHGVAPIWKHSPQIKLRNLLHYI